MNSEREKLYQQWEKCWSRNKNHNLTRMGKLMLKSKQKALQETLRELKISTAIDVGCGLGFMLEVFKDLEINTTGIDVSGTAIKLCQEKGLDARVKKLEDVNDKYDLVFSDGLLEHFLNFEPLVERMTWISNKYVSIIQTDHSSFWGKTSIYFAELLRDSKNVLEYNYRIKDFISIFKKYDFSLISNKKILGGIFQLLLFQKNNS